MTASAIGVASYLCIYAEREGNRGENVHSYALKFFLLLFLHALGTPRSWQRGRSGGALGIFQGCVPVSDEVTQSPSV